MIRIRDVTFDKTRFYDSAEIDSSHLLITVVKDTVKVLKVSNNIFFEVVIQKKNDRDEYVDHLENESVEKKIDQSEKSKDFQIDLKKSLFLTSEMTSKSNQTIFSVNTTDVIDSSTERKIFEMFVERDNVQRMIIERNDDVQRTLRIENDSQFLIKLKRKKNSTIMSVDFVAMNIRSRKNAYATALVIVFELNSFHAAFAIELKRSNQKKLKISKLHKDDLSIKSRY
jgi:hypothetical protein